MNRYYRTYLVVYIIVLEMQRNANIKITVIVKLLVANFGSCFTLSLVFTSTFSASQTKQASNDQRIMDWKERVQGSGSGLPALHCEKIKYSKSKYSQNTTNLLLVISVTTCFDSQGHHQANY